MRYFMIIYNDKTDRLIIDEMSSIVASLYSPTLPEVGKISMYDNYCHGGKDWICIMDGENAAEALKKFMEVMRL